MRGVSTVQVQLGGLITQLPPDGGPQLTGKPLHLHVDQIPLNECFMLYTSALCIAVSSKVHGH
jgi:hypothetical protein